MADWSLLSPALQAAQELLYKKRAEARAERIRLGLPVDLHLQQPGPLESATAEPTTIATALTQLPDHLGWGSTPATKNVRVALARREKAPESEAPVLPLPEQAPHPTTPSNPEKPASVKVYPTIAIAMLKQGYAPQARVYYLLRHLDHDGRGWLWLDDIREQLTAKKASLCIAKKKTSASNAWRSLRGIFNSGEGVLWERDSHGRVWLYGAAKIAVQLGCERLTGHPVQLLVKQLLGGIKQVRAHLYATFHTGREQDPHKHGPTHQPISQATLRELTGVPEATQRRYNKVAKVRIYKHYATGRQYDPDQHKEALYDRWGNAFKFTDYKGKQGAAGAAYIAHRLPNSYTTKTLQASKGRQAKINKRIDLVTNVGEEAAQANEQESVTVCAPSSLTHQTRGNGADVDRLFYHDSKQARRAHQRQPALDHFQQSPIRIVGGGRIWYMQCGAVQD